MAALRKYRRFSLWILIVSLCVVFGFNTKEERTVSGRIIPHELRTEYRTNPLGIDVSAPRLSWELRTSRPGLRNQRQVGYHVLVASTQELLQAGRGDLWDSGRVLSDANLHIPYAGEPLRSGQRVYWKVRAWDEYGLVSDWSEPAWWEMGLLTPEDWGGTWIGTGKATPDSEEAFYAEDPAPLFRKVFILQNKPVEKARIYISGLGYNELYLNGEIVGDQVLDPGWTRYDRRVLYSIYDVTEALQRGKNALGVMLGNGWYDPLPLRMFNEGLNLRETLPVGEPKLILQLNISYMDGTTQQIVSDDSWTISDGPILKNNIYLGEIYDATREQDGWSEVSFDDSKWSAAVIVDAPGGVLEAQDLPPIKVMRTIKPVSITEPQPGVYIFDMGQNFAGWITLRVSGKAGTKVTLRYGELLHPDGTLNPLTTAAGQIKDWAAIDQKDWKAIDEQLWWADGPYPPITALQSDTYVLKGDRIETYTPHFTWHGFRFVEVRGFPGTPSLRSLEGHLLHSAMEDVGSFTSSNSLFDRILEASMWALRSNLISVQSDCPHRERFGYGGDIVAASEMALLNLDMARFYTKTVEDFADAVRPNGGFTEIAPHVGLEVEGLGGGAGPVGWGTAHPMLVWQLYQYYGDRRIIEEQYENVQRWVDFLSNRAGGDILDNGISDHASVSLKPKALTGTAFFFYNTQLLARMAQVIDRKDDANRYRALGEDIKRAFNNRFLHQSSGRYGQATQASQAFALYMNLTPPSKERDALKVLVDSILIGHEGHLSTGIFGTKYLLDVLSSNGRADVAYTVANQTTFPSWGYMLENGATTLWEYWEKSEHIESHNHPMFGSVVEWFYKWLAGIQPHPDAVGFNRIIIRPQVVGDLKWVRGNYHSVRGLIESKWNLQGHMLNLEVTIPVNTTATIYVPASRPEDVFEGGTPANYVSGVTFRGMNAGAAVYEVGSGSYRFESRNFQASVNN